MIKGRSITYLLTLVVFAMVGLIFFLLGWNADSLLVAIRSTARTSLLLFSLAFTASSVNRLWPTTVSRWLLRNRRYIGVSFAVSLFTHLGLIITASLTYINQLFIALPPLPNVAMGIVTYAFIAFMALTSSNRAQAWFGIKRWQLLYRVGGHYIWFLFLLFYVGKTLSNPSFYAPFLIFCCGHYSAANRT